MKNDKKRAEFFTREPSDEEIGNACLWYDHSFGIMSQQEKNNCIYEAKEWLRAWKKVAGLL